MYLYVLRLIKRLTVIKPALNCVMYTLSPLILYVYATSTCFCLRSWLEHPLYGRGCRGIHTNSLIRSEYHYACGLWLYFVRVTATCKCWGSRTRHYIGNVGFHATLNNPTYIPIQGPPFIHSLILFAVVNWTSHNNNALVFDKKI